MRAKALVWWVGLVVGAYAACPGGDAQFLFNAPSLSICSSELPYTLEIINLSSGVLASGSNYNWYRNGTLFATTNDVNASVTDVLTAVGTYTYRLIAENPSLGCSDTFELTFTVLQGPTPNFTFSTSTPQCESNLPIFLTLNNSSNVANSPAQFTWKVNGSVFATTNNTAIPVFYTITAVGTYTFTLIVEDANGCVDSISKDFEVYPIPTANFTFTLPSPMCTNYPITFTNTSTDLVPGDYSVLWDFGDGNTSTDFSPTHSYTNPGTYTVTLTVINGPGTANCQDVATATITVLEGPVASISGDDGDGDTRYCLPPTDTSKTNTVIFTSNSTCPSGGCVYTWDFGDGSTLVTTQDTPVTYTYTTYGEFWATLHIVAPNGCESIDSIFVVFEPRFIQASFDVPPADLTGCPPHDVYITNIQDTNATQYTWDFGDGTVITGPPDTTSFTYTYTTPGLYTITLTASNACGYVIASYGPIEIAPLPTVSITGGPTIGCAPQTVNLTAVGTDIQPPNNYYWDMGDGTTYNDVGSVSHTYDTMGVYDVMLVGSNACGSDTAYVRIYVDSIPIARIDAVPTEGCYPLTVNFTNNSITNVLSNYSIYCTYPGVWASYCVEWWINNGVCCGPWYNPCGVRCPNYTSWDIPPQTFTNPSSGNVPVDHTVYYVIRNHCGSDDTTITITVHPPVVARFTMDKTEICVGDSITFTNVSWGDTLTFIWDFGEGTVVYDTAYRANLELPISYTIQYTVPDTYTVTLIANGYCGTDTLRRQVIVHPYPTAAFVVDTPEACLPHAFVFTNNSTTGGTYYWNFGGNATPSTSTAYNPPAVQYNSAGTYTVTLSVTVNGCTSTADTTIVVNPLPVPSFTVSPTAGCTPLTVLVRNTGDTANTYVWDWGDGTTSTGFNDSITHTYTNIYQTDTIYTIKLIATTPKGCVDSTTQNVTVYPRPIAAFTPQQDTVCLNNLASFINNSISALTYKWYFGDGDSSTLAQPTHLYPDSGNYIVTLIAYNLGCSDTTQLPLYIAPLPQAGFTATVECLGNPTQFTDTSKNAIAWYWNFGDGDTAMQQNPSHTYASAGTYTVELVVQNSLGCYDTTQQSIIVNTKPTANFNVSLACDKDTTWFTDLTTGSPISWTWYFGDGDTAQVQNPAHVYQDTGTYTVKLVVYSGIGCVDSIEKTVQVYPVPVVAFAFDTVCALDTTTFINNTNGAVSYNWDFGDGNTSTAVSPQHVYSSGGVYDVILTATNTVGCSASDTQSVLVYEKPVADFSANAVCLNAPTQFTDLTNITVATWQWDFGDGNSSNLQNPVHTYTNFGTYNVKLTVITADGCIDSIVKPVTVYSLPTADFTADTACYQHPTTFQDLSVDAVSWQWDFGDGNNATQQNPVYTYGAPDTYQVKLIVQNTYGCLDSIIKDVVVYPLPLPDFIVDTACWGYPNTFTDNSVGAVSWFWDLGDGTTATQSTVSHTYAQPDTYFVKLVVNNQYGCSDSITKEVLVLPKPIANFAYTPGCAFRPVQFADSSTGITTNWYWDFGDGNSSTQQNPVHIYNAGGFYTVTFVAGNGLGCADTAVQTVQVYTMPLVDFVADTVCRGDITHFTNLTQDSVPVNYFWDFGDGNSSFQTNPQYIYADTGVYMVTLYATNIYGCDTFITKPVLVTPVPEADFTADTACWGYPTTLTDNTTGYPDVWIWDFGDGTTDTVYTPTITHYFPTPGTYFVTLTVYSGSCADSKAKPVIVVDSIKAEFIMTDTVICAGDSVSFMDLSQGAPNWWIWNLGNGTATTQNVLNHPYPTPGIYTIYLTAGNKYCSNTDSARLFVIELPDALFNVENCCVYQPVPIENNSFLSDLPVNFYWSFGNGDSSTDVVPNYIYTQPGTYTITLVIDNGRCPDTMQRTITVYPLPQGQMQIQDTLTRVWREVRFTDITPSAVPIVDWLWQIGDTIISGVSDFTLVFPDTGIYPVKLIITDANGCSDTLFARVVVEGEFTIWVPNAFSPNGDGVNDYFYPVGLLFDAQSIDFRIYNRWGDLIWQTKTVGQGWDGIDQRTGKPAVEDAYVYVVEAVDFKGRVHRFVGTVTLLR